MTHVQIKNYRPTMYGSGEIGKNMSFFGTFCWSAGEQNWPPISQLESYDLSVSEFLYVSFTEIYQQTGQT